jgi:hypothetical protein
MVCQRDAADAPAKRFDYLLVPVELRIELRVDRPEAKRDVNAHENRNRHGEKSDEEQGDLGVPLCREYFQKADLLKPEPV